MTREMKIKRRYLKWGSALFAGVIAASYGIQIYAWGDDVDGCSLRDVQAYQDKLHSRTVEVTPRYTLRVAEEFIAACPLRFEVRDAYLTAARAALDAGKGTKSARYYQSALDTGAELSLAQRLDYAGALMSIGKMRRAAIMRDTAILHWAMQLSLDGTAHLKRIDTEGGAIYAAQFEKIDPKLKISALWIAAPADGGWPATAVIKPDAERGAWRALSQGSSIPQNLKVAELYRCRERYLIDDSLKGLSVQAIETRAIEALKAYLSAPDRLEKTPPGQPIAACVYPDRMLHRPRPETAIMPDSDLH